MRVATCPAKHGWLFPDAFENKFGNFVLPFLVRDRCGR
jgi:hypothetical protein